MTLCYIRTIHTKHINFYVCVVSVLSWVVRYVFVTIPMTYLCVTIAMFGPILGIMGRNHRHTIYICMLSMCYIYFIYVLYIWYQCVIYVLSTYYILFMCYLYVFFGLSIYYVLSMCYLFNICVILENVSYLCYLCVTLTMCYLTTNVIWNICIFTI